MPERDTASRAAAAADRIQAALNTDHDKDVAVFAEVGINTLSRARNGHNPTERIVKTLENAALRAEREAAGFGQETPDDMAEQVMGALKMMSPYARRRVAAEIHETVMRAAYADMQARFADTPTDTAKREDIAAMLEPAPTGLRDRS